MTETGAVGPRRPVLVLGIGNVLLGDEGVGPAVIEELQRHSLPPDVVCLDGGTGSFALLEPMQTARRVVLIDACADEGAPGTVRRLRPRFSCDYPATLTAHDVGLKDLLDALYLLGDPPEVTLFAVSIGFPQPMHWGVRAEMRERIAPIARMVLDELSAPGSS